MQSLWFAPGKKYAKITGMAVCRRHPHVHQGFEVIAVSRAIKSARFSDVSADNYSGAQENRYVESKKTCMPLFFRA